MQAASAPHPRDHVGSIVMACYPARRRVLLHFRTTYYTEWGQNLAVCGPGVLFGNYDPKRCGGRSVSVLGGLLHPAWQTRA
jgi:hypothetical protein